MKRFFTALALAVFLCSCAGMKLPEDTRVVAPASGVPVELAAYSGSWGGYMGDRKYRVVVEEISPPQVKAVFAWGELQGSA